MAELQIDDREIARLQRNLSIVAPNFVKRGLASAFGSTITASKKQSARIIRKRYNVKQGRILTDIFILTQDSRNFSFTLSGKKKTISVRQFGARQTAKGVSFRVLKSSPRALLTGSFEASSLGGPKLFFTRFEDEDDPMPFAIMQKGVNKGLRKQQIRVLKGPSAADMMDKDEFEQDLADFVEPRYANEVQRQIDRAIRQGLS